MTRGRTITDADLAAHAGVTGDFGFLHLDGPRAAQGHFGGRVAHGPLLIGIALGLGSMDVPQPATVAMVGTSWRFLRPVKPGMTVHAAWRLGRMRDVTNPRWGLAAWQVELFDQNEEQVLEGEVTLLVSRRESAAAATTAPRGRRRRGRGKPAAAAAAEVTPSEVVPQEVSPPEPAPADTPAPSRRRRRSGSRRPAEATPLVEAPSAPSEPAPAETVAPTSSSRRRRRRRGGGGGSNGGGSNGGAAAATSEAPPPEAAPPEPTRSEWAAPTPAWPAAPPQPEAGNPVSRALGRLRRPRPKPADQ